MDALPLQLNDCFEHGADSDAELFVVEGESGAKTVCRVRSRRNQAVLPMQGKPLNAMKAQEKDAWQNPHLSGLLRSLGVEDFRDVSPHNLRYRKIILLMDPDADGIHCGALLLLFFYRWLRPCLENGMLCAAHPPLWEVQSPALPQPVYSRSTKHYHQVRKALADQGVDQVQTKKFRGLGSMPDEVIYQHCIDSDSRRLSLLGTRDAEATIAAFENMKPA